MILNNFTQEDNKQTVADFLGDKCIMVCPKTINDIPTAIIYKSASVTIAPIIIILISLITGIIFSDFNFLPTMGLGFILLAVGLFMSTCIINGIMAYGYYIIEGNVVSVNEKKIDKSTKIIQMYNEEKDLYLSFRYTGQKSVEKGSPVTIYVFSLQEMVYENEIGSCIDDCLSVVFSKDTAEIGKKG